MKKTWQNDKVLCSIVEELQTIYHCNTIILYGSRARGDFKPTSDYDVAGIAPISDKKWIARFDVKNQVFHDIFIFPENELATPNETHLQMSDGIVLVDCNDVGKHLLKSLKKIERAPLPITDDEIQARKTWYQKMFSRAEIGDLEGKYRHIWIIFTILEDYFAFKKLRYHGPKKSFQYLAKHDLDVLNLFEYALSNTNNIKSLKQLIEKITQNTITIASPDKSTIEIVPASIQQQSVIAQLYELYTYEMTDLADFDINDDGYYRYQDLPLFWSTPNRYPYLIWVNNKLAGFVLIQQGSPIDDNPDVWDIAEFFIMRKFRKKGIGQFVAQSVWESHPGLWQIRVWENNLVAHQFWKNTVNNFTKKSIIPNKISYQGHDGLLVYKFEVMRGCNAKLLLT